MLAMIKSQYQYSIRQPVRYCSYTVDAFCDIVLWYFTQVVSYCLMKPLLSNQSLLSEVIMNDNPMFCGCHLSWILMIDVRVNHSDCFTPDSWATTQDTETKCSPSHIPKCLSRYVPLQVWVSGQTCVSYGQFKICWFDDLTYYRSQFYNFTSESLSNEIFCHPQAVGKLPATRRQIGRVIMSAQLLYHLLRAVSYSRAEIFLLILLAPGTQ